MKECNAYFKIFLFHIFKNMPWGHEIIFILKTLSFQLFYLTKMKRIYSSFKNKNKTKFVQPQVQAVQKHKSALDQFCDFTSLVGFRLLHSNVSTQKTHRQKTQGQKTHRQKTHRQKTHKDRIPTDKRPTTIFQFYLHKFWRERCVNFISFP